jgi:hypothetical protein
VHCIGEDATMGKGFAEQVKFQFNCQSLIREQKKKVGEIAIIPVNNQQYIFNLITKPCSSQPPIDDAALMICLAELGILCESKGINHIYAENSQRLGPSSKETSRELFANNI